MTPRPDVGIQLPEVERDVRWPEYVAMARAAEECGFDSLWLGDHLIYRDDGRPERGPWDCWSMLAGLAAVTSRVRLGPLVACLGFRPPGQLARAAAAVDEMSGGRLVLGVGAGWNRAEFEAFGIPFDRRAARFEEAFEIVVRLLSCERVTQEGRFYSLSDAVLLPEPARRIPVMLGGNGDRLLAAALPRVDAWNTWFDDFANTPQGFDELNQRITAAAQQAGRDPADIRRSACVRVVLDPSSTERPLTPGIEPLAGSPQEIAAGIRAMSDAGADEIILVSTPIDEPAIRTLGEAVELLDR